MKIRSIAMLLVVVTLLSVESTGRAEPIKKDEIDYQNYAFKQWYGTTLVWRYDRLPKSAAIPEHRRPYSGDIYLDSQGGTVNGMNKYDHAFHEGESKATQFEWRDIALRGTTRWAGHCNGWTAAAIRHAEPQKSVTRNGVVFSPADIKELLAELYVYADTEFLGGIDVAINPGTLHVVMTNWIGRGKHPIGVETTLGREVWNYPAYSFTSESYAYDDRHVEVRMNVECADFLRYEYDQAPKKTHPLYFHYILTLNEDGEIVDGTYLYDSHQIDMLWVPMKPTLGGTEGNEEGNPHIDPDVIVGMWRESVPESVRTKWYVIDPLPEDAVLVAEWFQVEPTADDTRLEYIPERTLEQAQNLELAVKKLAETPEATSTAESVDSGPTAPDTATEDSDEVGEVQPADAIPVVEVFRERFPNGSLKVEREVTLGDKYDYIGHGTYRQWSEEGALIAEGRFDMGRRVGEWRRAYAADDNELFSRAPFKLFKGPFVSAATFRNGRLHGAWTIHDSEDRIASQIDFVDGAREGNLRYFYPNGSKMREIDFRNGVVDGYLREFNEAGKVMLEHKYSDGHYRTVKIEKFVSTTKKSETNLLYPRMTIKTRDDWWNAKVAEYGIEAGEPLRHGLQTVWYDNGQLRFRGEFEAGKPAGEFIWHQENGQVSRKGRYADGKQHGSWSWWHNDGSKSVLGSYNHGTPVGRWLFWKPGGELEQVMDLSATGQPVPEGRPVDERSMAEPAFPEPAPEENEPEVETGPRIPALPETSTAHSA